MQLLVGGLTSLFGGGAAAGTTWAAANAGAAATTTAASGISLSSILQGTATVLGIVSSIGAGNADAAQAEMAAKDAESEQNLETLQGISRRTSIRKQMAEALGAEDVAYAASGVDLSFGTARNARTDAYREADLALTTDTGTEQTRISRLVERARNYRAMAKQARAGGVLNALTGGVKGLMDITGRY
ncbi:putative golgin autoantigen [Mesorhizobium plurifarium]|uniref:Putative golgin autoantigen n=1 Tax=Mesorhizobium plurifarium TaxID=69974 RepID=A0A0K2VUT9_MESPL|nr:putative golgin autoantigen [Mesorhizobium plurifarium]